MKLNPPIWRILPLFAGLTLLSSVSLLGGAGCESETAALLRALGQGCLINSDCEDSLVCVFRRCHAECESSVDCPLSADGERLRCVIGQDASHVCQLDDERACDYTSQCPGEQLCGPDGNCRDACAGDRDCLGEQICVQGVCAEQEEVSPANPYLPIVPRPPEQQTGLTCEYNNECEDVAPPDGPPFVCRDGICAYDCFLDIDCAPNTICDPQDGDNTTPGVCVPGTSAGPIYCTPGAQVLCECPGGLPDDGIQVCADDGLRFEPCMNESGVSCALSQP